MTATLAGWWPRLAVAAPAPNGGVALDAYGGLHPFGNVTLSTGGAPYWPGWDIARSLVVLPNLSGGWILDGWGGIHAFGEAPAISPPHYTQGQDIARAMAVLGVPATDNPAGYVLDSDGTLYSFGGAPSLPAAPAPPGTQAVGLLLDPAAAAAEPRGWVLLSDGVIDSVAGAPPLAPLPRPVVPVWRQLHLGGGTVYGVAKYGVVRADGGSLAADWSGYTDWGSWDITRDVVLVGQGVGGPQPTSAGAQAGYADAFKQAGGAVLDGFGGVHPFGGLVVDTVGAPYWQGWDIARSLQLTGDGSGGWILDGWGGIHAFGSAAAIADPPAYWPGWDIARALVVTNSGRTQGSPAGYVLDAWGGLHPFGGAPQLSDPFYWQGENVAAGLVIHENAAGTPDGGAVIDVHGAIHTFGAEPAATVTPPVYPQQPTYLALHAVDGALYAVQRFGRVVAASPQPVAPTWTGYDDFGNWDIMRDLVLTTSTAGTGAQPVSPEAATAFQDVAWMAQIPAPVFLQEYPESCETAAARVALLAEGVNVSEDWLLAWESVDPRRAQMSGGRILRWGDPYTNFVGVVTGSQAAGTGYGVYYGPIAQAIDDAGRTAVGGTGWTMAQVFDQVGQGHPVVVWLLNTYTPGTVSWWTAWDGRSVPYHLDEHAVTLIGVDPIAHTVRLADVGWGIYRTLSWSQFEATWSTFDYMAVAVS